MINSLKKNKFLIIELSLMFFVTLIFNLIFNNLNHDEIWNYGFSYNIASGLVPYCDFNMVVTPLFSIIGALFLVFFGKNMVIYHVFNAIVCILIFYYLKKNNSRSYYISYGILLLFALPNYSLFCILLLYILIDLEEKKYNNYLIGFVLGLVFLTKQNIGIYLWVPTLLIFKWDVLFKRLIGFLIPNILLLIYLIMNDCLYEFVDYTFLGISSFAKENLVLNVWCLVFVVLILIYLVYKFIKMRDIKIIYLICIQGLAYPIIDLYHVALPFVVGFNFFLSELRLNKKILSWAFLIFLIYVSFSNFNLYLSDNFSYPNNSHVFKYRKLNNEFIYTTEIVLEYISNIEGNVYFINMYAYLLDLESGRTIDKYDLLNDGNLGKNGEKKIIREFDEICSEEKCLFILDNRDIGKSSYTQYNQEIYKYIVNNYKKSDNLLKFSIYTNY